jgi:beta-glucosidase
MSDCARLIVPAIRWSSEDGFEGQRAGIERALSLGCGGFIIFGGEAAAVRQLTSELRNHSSVPLLIASDLERGAGQQFSGATGLPPLAAIGARESGAADAAERAARLTAREALALGVNWILAPVCDLDVEPDNPIIGTRSFGSSPAVVSELVARWIDACQATGAMACAKHFPGHGRTTVDSHAALPGVEASEAELWQSDLAPFRAAIDAGVSSILTAHVAFPSLDASGGPATLSPKILRTLLRDRLKFDGLVASDAMIMEGVLRGRSEAQVCIDALIAGCDMVLYPVDVPEVVQALKHALKSGVLDPEGVQRSLFRIENWAAWTAPAARGEFDFGSEWAQRFAVECVVEVRGRLSALSSRLDVLVLDDDVGGPYPPPSREPFLAELRSHGFDARWTGDASPESQRSLIIALFGDIRSWKGRPGYSNASMKALAQLLEREPGALLLQFSAPRLVEQLPPEAQRVVSAWGGERAMQAAAAQWLASRAGL